MQYTKDLVFFDKSGTGYGFDWDETNELWTGSIFIEPVSEGLFETEKIILLQKYVIKEEDTDSTLPNPVKTIVYGYPASVYPDGSGDYYEFRWDEDVKEVDEIRLFGFDRNICPSEDTSALTYREYNCPNIVFMDNVRVENLKCDPVSYDNTTTINGITTVTYKKEPNWSMSYADINISFCDTNDDYSTFRRDLLLYYVSPNGDETLVGKFVVYAQSIEEDERLTAMCKNLGYGINNIDFSILQDSDIKEQLIDHKLMNQKKKEMLMEGHNIYPYIGSYKSVINAIRFFGYDNVTIKEWWKNVDIESENYGKHFMASSYSLKDHEVIHTDTNVTLPSKKFRKTGKLTLAYDINKVQDIPAQSSYKGHEYPETGEQFTDYTIEEAVIKLYGLKRKLEKEFLPLTTRIIDITGEGSSFYASTIRHTMSQNTGFNTISGARNTFSILGSQDGCFYMEDLRPFGIHPNEAPSGNGIVGESRNGNPNFIGAGYRSLYDSPIQTGSDLQEFGQEPLSEYDTNWNDLAPYSQIAQQLRTDDDLDYLAGGENIQMTGSLADIENIQGSGVCQTGTDYHGPLGVMPPYNMTGNNLFGVGGLTFNNCEPWIYYIQQNESSNGNYYLAEFSSYYPNLNETYRRYNDFESEESRHLPDNENIPVGALVELKIDEIDATWNDLTFTWEFARHVTWRYMNLFVGNVCRVEWDIHKDEDTNPGFDITIAGMVSHGYSDIGVVLPYIGTYDIVLRIFDWNNNVSIINKPNAITVYPREVEFTGWCKMKTHLLTWSSSRIWDSLSVEWNFPYENYLTWNDLKSSMFVGMDRGSFTGQYVDTPEVDERMMIYNFNDGVHNGYSLMEDNRGAYFWDNLDVAWQDIDHLWWDALNITGDIPCYFEFGYFDFSANPTDSQPNQGDSLPGKWLEIVDKNNNYGAFRFPTSVSSLNYIADVTRQLNESTDRVLSQFFYSYVWDFDTSHQNPPFNVPEGFHIVATSKNHGRGGDIKYVGIVSTNYHAYTDMDNILHVRKDPDNFQLRFFTNSVECNPNWNDCVCINNITNVPAYTDVNFNYTNCRILGKKNPEWKFTNLNTGTVYTSTKRNYHRLFKEKGCWEVSLTLNDTNGNVYSAARNILNIV